MLTDKGEGSIVRVTIIESILGSDVPTWIITLAESSGISPSAINFNNSKRPQSCSISDRFIPVSPVKVFVKTPYSAPDIILA